ncbi:DNA polymerase processivity factor [Arthrobacter phage KBurrousTX]|uniref:DNA polymerase III sliding clamp n=1 Tax=Arthrobacter phage KBurrousTX TaxID=2315608 RepID=A0A386KB91_9CAUD|nr:DNA polymerase processivity factor [Arthrobacter phage KBurrousTX]AYD81594.1 DNA polymerase III sliding clamp [Arthrobacter phage KBurrousTX]
MKLTIDSSALNESVAFAARAVNPRHAQPILTGIWLEATGGVLTVRGFDQVNSNAVQVAADIEEDGTALLPGAVLANILKTLPNSKPLDLSIDDRATLKVGRAKFSTQKMDASQYPQMPGLPKRLGSVDSNLFAGAVAQVQHAAGKNTTPPVLNGIKVELRGNVLSLLATDRYRMAYAELPIDRYEDSQDDMDFLVAPEVLTGAARANSGKLDVLGSDQRMGFVSATRATTSNVMGGDFPNVRALFPSAAQLVYECTVDTADLLSAVTRAAVVIEGQDPVRLNFRQGEVVVDAGGLDSNAGEEALEAFHTFEEDQAVGFNAAFLAEALRALTADQVVFGFQGGVNVRPVLIREKGGTFNQQLIMPIRLT